jgi:hypothetical protein
MDVIYREKISFFIGKLVVVLMIALTALFLGLFLYQILESPIGTKPAPDWYYLILCLIFLGISMLMYNFRELTITANNQNITIAYGRIKYTIAWENVKGYYLDESSGVSYGGWGIRIGLSRGRTVLVYNIVGCPRVVLELYKGRFSQFAFSTKQPEEVMEIIKVQTGVQI